METKSVAPTERFHGPFSASLYALGSRPRSEENDPDRRVRRVPRPAKRVISLEDRGLIPISIESHARHDGARAPHGPSPTTAWIASITRFGDVLYSQGNVSYAQGNASHPRGDASDDPQTRPGRTAGPGSGSDDCVAATRRTFPQSFSLHQHRSRPDESGPGGALSGSSAWRSNSISIDGCRAAVPAAPAVPAVPARKRSTGAPVREASSKGSSSVCMVSSSRNDTACHAPGRGNWRVFPASLSRTR